MVTLWVMHLATTEETKILMIKHEEDERINPKTRGKGSCGDADTSRSTTKPSEPLELGMLNLASQILCCFS